MMKLYLSILFDRPMNQYDCIPSPGGYEVMTADGNTYGLDFNDSEGGVSQDNPQIVEWCLRNEDVITFPQITELSGKLSQIIKITECYLDMEHFPNQEDLPLPIAILGFQLTAASIMENVPESTDYIEVTAYGTPASLVDFKATDKMLAAYKFDAVDERWYSLLNVWSEHHGVVEGAWIQDHYGTLESAEKVARETESANSDRITVAVVHKLNGVSSGRFCAGAIRLDNKKING